MEELLIEEKAKRYDSMFERLKEMYNNNKTNVADRLIYERYFPELKESEDERMIQYFKDLAPFDNADELYEKYGFSHKDAIVWLKKQCEHANFRNKIQVGDKVTRNEDGVLVNLSQLKRIAKPAEEYNITGIGSKNAQGKLGEMIKNLKPVNEVLEHDSAWSEEDVNALNRISTILVDASEVKNWWKKYRLIERNEMIKLTDFLKSLKDRYTWKPTEEQIEALDSATENCAYSEYQDCLRELIRQLKKLRQE